MTRFSIFLTAWRQLWLISAMALICLLLPDILSAQPPVVRLDQQPFYRWRKIWQPARFQGVRAPRGYYEGWYFKVVTEDGQALAMIPGISWSADPHAFIQVINGKTAETHYFRFPVEDFSYSQREFAVQIGGNRFGTAGIRVDLGEGEQRIAADLHFSGLTRLPPKAVWPGIMGWYRFVPGMETYHGLVSMDHAVEGSLHLNGQDLTVGQGRGYIEKDWGSSMPESWVWIQSNHFPETGTSFMCSIARVPWMGSAFQGFLGFFLHQGDVYRFSTYTGARIEELEIAPEAVSFWIRDRRFAIRVIAQRKRSGELRAPVQGEMDRRIAESVDAQVNLEVFLAGDSLWYRGSGSFAGLEVVGDVRESAPKGKRRQR